MFKRFASVTALSSVCTLLLPSLGLATGADSSGGGRILADQENPWFLGDEVVQVCLEKSADYSQSLEAAQREVQAALNDWQKTLTNLDISETRSPLPDGKKKTLSKKFVLQQECNESSELKILL